MANLSEDIQCAGSDTRPPMLDRTDFASWQQCIRLYCRGPERARVYSDLSPEDKDRYNADIRATNILLQGLPKDIYTLINHYTEAKTFGIIFVTAVKLNRGLRDSNYDQLYAYLKQHEAHANENKMTTSSNTRNQATVQDGRVVVQNVQGRQNRGQGNNARGTGHIERNCTQTKRPQNLEYFKDKMLMMQAQENRVALDEEQLLFIAGGQDNVVDEDVDEQLVQDLALNVDNVFQADDCDAFDSNVDEAPTAQTMFMVNLSSADPVYDKASPSYDSDIPSKMREDVQLNYVVDSHADYTSDSNMIPYHQYVKDNAVPVVQSNVSSVPNDAYMMIENDMHEQSVQCVSMTTQLNVVNKSLTAELATYKEQVELYETRAKFELTEREQKIDEQLRIVIADRNIKEENLKRKLHSIKLQLNSTINHNKSMVEEVTSLKKDFKQ
ncbi:hypothetical protein Tco_1201974 [Tanacetum coccineum]